MSKKENELKVREASVDKEKARLAKLFQDLRAEKKHYERNFFSKKEIDSNLLVTQINRGKNNLMDVGVDLKKEIFFKGQNEAVAAKETAWQI